MSGVAVSADHVNLVVMFLFVLASPFFLVFFAAASYYADCSVVVPACGSDGAGVPHLLVFCANTLIGGSGPLSSRLFGSSLLSGTA